MTKRELIDKIFMRCSWLRSLIFYCYNHAIFNNQLKVNKKNRLVLNKGILTKTKIGIKNGKENEVWLDSMAILHNCKVHIGGNNNKIRIGKNVSLRGVQIWIEDDNNEVTIGDNTTMEGNVHLSCIEGTQIHIGSDCMFSANITFRTGDSHSVVNLLGDRINASENIIIEDHVWIGNGVTILKGSIVKENSVVGMNAVVAKKIETAGVAIAGNPAKIVKENISWCRERL